MKTAIKILFVALATFQGNLISQESAPRQPQPVDTGYIEVENGRLFYEQAGQGLTIVLLHDGMVDRRIWDEQFQLYAREYRVVRYDRRTFGKSSNPSGPFSHLDDLDRLFVQLKIDKAIVFGMSSGGGLAIDFTLKYPSKVSGLVLVGAVVGGLGYSSHMGLRGGHMLPPSERSDQRKLARYFVMDDPYEIYRENTEAKARVMEMMKDYPSEGRDAGIIPTRPERTALKHLSEITVPTLILAGEFDIPDVHAHAGAINAGISDSRRIIIPGSGHLIPIEQPGLFNAEVLKFLKWF